MEKLLGFKLLDNIKEVGEYECIKIQLSSAIYTKKINEKMNKAIKLFYDNLEAQSKVFGVNLNNYNSRVEAIKRNYQDEIKKIKEEYAFQFVNMQLEYREAVTNQKIALVNAKKMYDLKKEYLESMNKMLENDDKVAEINSSAQSYDEKIKKCLDRFYEYKTIVRECEEKIENCMENSFQEIEKIANRNIEKSISLKDENVITKLINKIVNLFSGKSKFERKINELEKNISTSNIESNDRVNEIRNDTIQLVTDIQIKKDSLSAV